MWFKSIGSNYKNWESKVVSIDMFRTYGPKDTTYYPLSFSMITASHIAQISIFFAITCPYKYYTGAGSEMIIFGYGSY